MRALVTVGVMVLAMASLATARQSLDVGVHGDASATQNDELVLRGVLAGQTRGTFTVTVRWDGDPKVVGQWHLRFETQTPDGSLVETGSLHGTVTDGRIEPLPGGSGSALSDLALTVQEGSGQHAAVASGSGRAELRVGRPGEPFTGHLSITF
jgi:hypothetical protein